MTKQDEVLDVCFSVEAKQSAKDNVVSLMLKFICFCEDESLHVRNT